MNEAFVLVGISPIVAVADVRRSVDFYVRHLGFESMFVSESYGVVLLQTQSVHFVPAADAAALEATRRNCSFRLRVRNLDAYWRQVEATAPPTRIRPPKMEPWGLREFHILDADGALLIVGEDG